MRKLLSLVLALLISMTTTVAFAMEPADTKVSVDFVNQSPDKILKEIGRQSGLNIVYKSDDVKKWGKITLKATNQPAETLISEIARKTGEEYSIKNNIVIFGKKQGKINAMVHGIVVDETGDPLPGASVIVQGTNIGTSTNVDGEFSLKVDADSPVLQVTYVGMRPNMIALTSHNTTGTIKIKLGPNASLMNEVVFTGYQEVKKEKMTGSVTTISADKLEDRYTPNLIQNLEGRVAGLSTYGGKPVIRGVGTFHAGSNPLLVVDGLPVESSIDDINPSDIESINVLKDAAASAIYGARAANGIIVITTKNAKNQGKIDIDISCNVTIYEKNNVDYADNFYLTPEQHVDIESKYLDYYFNSGEISDPIGAVENSLKQGSEITPLRYAYYRKAKDEISQNELNQIITSLKKNNFARDFAKNILHRQVMQQYNLAVRNRSENSRTNLVVNYKTDNETLLNHRNNWLNVSFKSSYDFTKWLTATVSVNSIIASKKGYGYDANSMASDIWAYAPYTPFYNEDGTIRNQYPWFSGSRYWTPEKGCEDLGVNPVNEMFDNVETTQRQNMRYHADLMFKIISGLTFNTQFIYESDNIEWQQNASAESHAARTIKNAYAYEEGGEVKYQTPSGGFLRTKNTRGNYWTARFQLNYQKTIADKHDINGIVGFELRETKHKGNKSIEMGYDEQLQNSSTNVVDFGLLSQIRYSPYYMTDNGGFPCQQFAYDAYMKDGMGLVKETLHRYGSGYFNLTYTYDNRYNIFGSFRKDYADVYGLDSKFRGKPLWSIGAGWNAHNEKFMRDLTYINFMKLRFSYGITGNIYQGASSLRTASTDGFNTSTNLPVGTVNSPANPDLRWEQNRTTNIGIDFSILDFRLRGSIDWYDKRGKDIFNSMNLDPSTGFTSMVANVASIRNHGFEMALSYDWFRPKSSTDFRWTTSLTLTFNKNRVESVENDASTCRQLIDNPYMTGYPVNALWSYRFAGISDRDGEKGQPLFYVEEGAKQTSAQESSIDCLEFSGQSDPKTIIAMDNSLQWSGFNFGLVLAYYGGHKMRALQEDVTTASKFGEPLGSYFINAWTPENPTNTPGIGQYASKSMGPETTYSNSAIHDASFIKIRNIILGYDLPKQLIRKIGLKNAQIKFQINNPKAIWTANKLGVDPETLGLRERASYMVGFNFNL